MTRYLLDSNVFIQAKNLQYGFDFCPAFWDYLIAGNQQGVVASVQKVEEELMAIDDDLSTWVSERDESFFIEADDKVSEASTKVGDWAIANRFDPTAVTVFLQRADFWLIAHALAYDCIVVTHEVPANTVKKIKIPNVCVGLGVSWATPFEMLRREKVRFILG